ncbi:MAG: hypothetical protein P3X22_007250 [Thermoprotei archaeon]|nr:hypothetical protein [Thermoprotei archaeon]
MVSFELLLAALSMAAPIMIAALGELLLERSGRVNLGVEGMMAFGASVSIMVTSISDSPVIGLLGGLAGGFIISSIYTVAVLALRLDQIVVGLLTVFLGIGLADLLAATGHTIAPALTPWSPAHMTIIFLTLAAPAALWILLYKTWVGVEVRAIGTDELAARERGLRVDIIRTIAALTGGAAAGVAGAYMALTIYNGKYFSGLTAGWGWLAIGSVILGFWNPVGVAVAAYSIGLLILLRPYTISLGVPSYIAHATPYIAVLLALIIVSRLARSPRWKPPQTL